MQFKKSDSYTLTGNLPRLINEESQYKIDEIPIRETEDYSIVRLSSLYNMSKYNGLSIQESLDSISSNIHKPLLILVNENMMYYDIEYAYLALSEATKYEIGIEPMKYTFDSILEECIQVDISNNDTKYTDMLLEAIDMSPNPNTNPSMEDNIRNAADAPGAMIYGAYKKGKDIKSWFGNKVNDMFLNVGKKALNAMDTPEMREKASNMVGNIASKSFDKITGAAKDSVTPVMHGFTGGAVVGATLAAAVASVNKLTSSDSMSANGENAANIINSLKASFNSLTNMQMNAPPQQKGIIGRLLQKIKNAISTLGRKIGL